MVLIYMKSKRINTTNRIFQYMKEGNDSSLKGMSIKARLHDAIFAYDCCMQLADAIPATLCRLSRRYDYCMRLFQPRDILDLLSSFFFTLSWSHFEQEAYQFRFLSSHC
jgi:hypothetical protein